MMAEYIQILTTTEKAEDAEQIAQALVEKRLAACVQIVGPITSIYRWQRKIERAQEFQCWIKTRQALFERVQTAIRKLHSYEVPEILAVPVLEGGKDYLSWLDDSIVKTSPPSVKP
jgi:periplasmic divalent cation tolerance protein